MLKLGLSDQISIVVEPGSGIDVRVQGRPDLDQKSNLCFAAVEKILKFCPHQEQKISVEIEKHIPIAAGLAGGSTDAAFVLQNLPSLLNVEISNQDLLEMSKSLGADVAFFLGQDNLAILDGRGDVLRSSTSIPPLPLLLVHPPVSVPTGKVFEMLGRSLTWPEGSDNSSLHDLDVSCWRDLSFFYEKGNDLEAVTQKIHPEIGLIRKGMLDQGALFSAMSGSGATVFGLFDHEQYAQKASEKLSKYGRVYCTHALS